VKGQGSGKTGWNVQAPWLPLVLVSSFLAWVWLAGPPKATELEVSGQVEEISLKQARLIMEGDPANEIEVISGVSSQLRIRLKPVANFRGSIRLNLSGDPRVIKWLGARLEEKEFYLEGEKTIRISFKPMTAYLKTGNYSLNLVAEDEEGELVGVTRLRIMLIGAEIAGC